jgi:hypothetical protein
MRNCTILTNNAWIDDLVLATRPSPSHARRILDLDFFPICEFVSQPFLAKYLIHGLHSLLALAAPRRTKQRLDEVQGQFIGAETKVVENRIIGHVRSVIHGLKQASVLLPNLICHLIKGLRVQMAVERTAPKIVHGID